MYSLKTMKQMYRESGADVKSKTWLGKSCLEFVFGDGQRKRARKQIISTLNDMFSISSCA